MLCFCLILTNCSAQVKDRLNRVRVNEISDPSVVCKYGEIYRLLRNGKFFKLLCL